jgi:hypothetical protein
MGRPKNRKYPYWEWEDYQAGLFAIVSPVEMPERSKEAANKMRQIKQWGDCMDRVIKEWPKSSSQNLLPSALGHCRAWIGQAAMCLWCGTPAGVTRNAWWRLDENEKREANARADRAVNSFRCHQNVQMELFK